MTLLAILLAASAAQDGEEKPYTPKHKLEFKLAIEEHDGAWQFVIEGTTDLPDGARLRARVYALEEVDDYQGGKRVDEEGLSPKINRAFHEFEVRGGRFREVAYESGRRPYSLPYRARVRYEPDRQEEEIARKVDEQEFAVASDFRRGTEPDYRRELQETLRELGGELETIQTLFRDFKATYLAHQQKFDPTAWNAWSKRWLEKIDHVSERNEDRWELWTIWLERQGKFRIDGFVDRFRHLMAECTDALQGDADALVRVSKSFELFLIAFDEAREVMGIDAPFDPESVVAALGPYEKVVARLREIVAKPDREAWTAEAADLRRRARAALLALGSQKLVPRRGYTRVLALTERFLEIHDLAAAVLGGPGDAGQAQRLSAALAEHDRQLHDFREYAGLK